MKSLSLSSPHIIATVGIPGAGKTFFAEQFSDTFSSPLMSKHHLSNLTNDDEIITSIEEKLLKEVMKTRQTIVLDSSLDRKIERMALAKFARQHGYKVLFVWVQTDQTTARSRSQKVISSVDFLSRLKKFSPPHTAEPYVVISGKHTYASQAKMLLKHLSDESRSHVEQKPKTSLPIVPPRSATSRIRVL